MLTQPDIRPTIPASDLDRARQFYEGVLGLTPARTGDEGIVYAGGNGTGFLLFQSSGKASGTHTQMSFGVDDVAAQVRDLKARGVIFEHYDMPGADPETGIVEFAGNHLAWFHDTEGNLLTISDAREPA